MDIIAKGYPVTRIINIEEGGV